MPKFIISWDAGFGESYECVEAESLEEAKRMAHDEWEQEAASNAAYAAKPLTPDTATEYGFEDELDEES